MAQIFHRSTNFISRLTIYGAVVIIGALGYALYAIAMSPWYTDQNVKRQQPVPFSHRHHAGELGIDCRYCHTSVENSNFAGIPPTKTCMNCHQQIWTNAPMLEPVRESFRSGHSIVWTRVNAVPDYVYFDHSIHVNKGVGCYSCHGPVNKMPLMYEANSLRMEWCLNCHRAPEKFLRPREEVFNMDYREPSVNSPVKLADGQTFTDQLELGKVLKRSYNVRSVEAITSCNTCHR